MCYTVSNRSVKGGNGVARKARVRAESGVYYIKIESADRLIFVDDEDGRTFVRELEQVAGDDFADVYAYCLQNERIDLVLKEGLSGISPLVRRLLSGYTLYCNRRNGSSGKLFYDRFKSLPLEEADDILDAVRYVHRLPLALGLGDKYEFCGHRKILRGEMGQDLVLLAGNPSAFRSYMAEPAVFCGFDKPTLSDEALTEKAREILAGYSQERLNAEYDLVLGKLLDIEGVTVGKLCRVLGISRRRLTRVAEEKRHA